MNWGVHSIFSIAQLKSIEFLTENSFERIYFTTVEIIAEKENSRSESWKIHDIHNAYVLVTIDDVFSFSLLFWRQTSKWSQWFDQNVNESLIMFNILSCFFIQDFSKINLWFFNFVINNDVNFFDVH